MRQRHIITKYYGLCFIMCAILLYKWQCGRWVHISIITHVLEMGCTTILEWSWHFQAIGIFQLYCNLHGTTVTYVVFPWASLFCNTCLSWRWSQGRSCAVSSSRRTPTQGFQMCYWFRALHVRWLIFIVDLTGFKITMETTSGMTTRVFPEKSVWVGETYLFVAPMDWGPRLSEKEEESRVPSFIWLCFLIRHDVTCHLMFLLGHLHDMPAMMECTFKLWDKNTSFFPWAAFCQEK